MTGPIARSKVVTGVCVQSAAGLGADRVLDAMAAGRTFVRDPAAGPIPAAGLLPWPRDPALVDIVKYTNDAARTAVATAGYALDQAGIERPVDPTRAGIVLGLGVAGTEELGSDDSDGLYPRLAREFADDPRPLPTLLYDEVPDFAYLRGIPSLAGQFIARRSGFTGSSTAVCGESDPAGLGALALATHLVDGGELDQVVVVSVAPRRSRLAIAALGRDEALATRAGPGSGPFDAARTGMFVAEGAAAVVVEAADTARDRGAAPQAQLLGCATRCGPTGRQALEAAIDAVLAGARGGPGARGGTREVCPVGLCLSHGSGSPASDRDAARAIRPRLDAPVTATRGTIGNAPECGGLIDLAVAVRLLGARQVPPVGLLRAVDPALAGIDLVRGVPRPVPPLAAILTTATAAGRSCQSSGAVLIGGVPR